MEQRKKQILLERLTEYNKTVNNMSKFKLNTKEENLFCDIMQQFAEEYHTEQLRQSNIVGRSEQFYCTCSRAKGLDHDEDGMPYCIECQKPVQ